MRIKKSHEKKKKSVNKILDVVNQVLEMHTRIPDRTRLSVLCTVEDMLTYGISALVKDNLDGVINAEILLKESEGNKNENKN